MVGHYLQYWLVIDPFLKGQRETPGGTPNQKTKFRTSGLATWQLQKAKKQLPTRNLGSEPKEPGSDKLTKPPMPPVFFWGGTEPQKKGTTETPKSFCPEVGAPAAMTSQRELKTMKTSSAFQAQSCDPPKILTAQTGGSADRPIEILGSDSML